MHTNFLHASKLIEGMIVNSEPEHRIIIDIQSIKTKHIVKAFLDAHKRASFICRKHKEIKLDTLIMSDVSGMQSQSSYNYHCTNLAIAIEAVDENNTESDLNLAYGLENKLSPNDCIRHLIAKKKSKVENNPHMM
jgi:hypothetical protein